MKKIITLLILLVLGGGVGGGAAYATLRLLGPPAPARPVEPPLAFVPAQKVNAPLVLGDGRLAGYVSFDFGVQVPEDQVATVTTKLPLLLHAINMRTYRTPLATGPDGMLPDIEGLRRVVLAAAPEALGKGVVRRVAITRAEPA
jgi:hypothetical protein